MTTDEALTRLRDDWSLSKDDDYRTDEPGWAVYSLMNGEIYERLGWGRTPVEAIDAAEAQIVVNEREQAERDADYARRKAAGQLTALEKASDGTAALWTTAVLAEIEGPSILAGLVNRAYEGEIAETGTTITINRHNYSGHQIK